MNRPSPTIEIAPFVDDAPFQQSRAYAEAVNALGGAAHGLAIRQGTTQIATATILRRRFLGLLTVSMVQRGPVWSGAPDVETRRAAFAALRAWAPGVLLIQPEDPADALALGRARIMTGVSVARLDLTGGEAALRARMRGKWRNRLVRSLEAPVRIRVERDWGWLLARVHEAAGDKGYRPLPAALSLSAGAAAGAGNVLALVAVSAGEPIAGMVFFRHGRTASYHLGWTGTGGREAGAHHRLLWAAMTRLAARGVETLDLGALDTVNAPGLARFKLGAGAGVLETPGTFLYGITRRSSAMPRSASAPSKTSSTPATVASQENPSA